MSRPDHTDITLVLDRSGSMNSIKQPTIAAFNQFVLSQRTGVGSARLTLVQFDDQYEVVYSAQLVSDAPLLNDDSYQPRGSTALLDAMGRTMVATGERLKAMPEAERPDTVFFVTLTDGEENSSVEFTLPRIHSMIAEQRDKYAWQFLFLAANQDAIATATQMGVSADAAMTFTASPTGAAATFNAVGKEIHKVRAAKMRGVVPAPVCFSPDDRKAAGK